MSETANADLYRDTVALLQPGDVTLAGAVIHTTYDNDEESKLHQLTLDAGQVVADHVADGDTYVYSGNDDSDFGVNQHQGRILDDDAFVWECQQLLRDGAFAVVLYWEATDDHAAILDGIRDCDGVTSVVAVTEDGFEA
ncbi:MULTISPECIES: DUF5778 family protein [Halobacterium]|uniref:Uncharacterized protein n=4 Tax=Halobacterium salinarum TaxID=2242 RepID=Q9HP69_HALSA|nr:MULTISPECIES: DUF5778 family protein [Halobacterium]AAG20001.1 hypothetical protein VNG_1777H [Halobacterium salinarum NRC-1]MBB6089009.1 hypothetical protein [Halobacterium salinarum]MCF2164770.1 hypothetical protein [Halobacterium salinarum]MCF2168189.1 hypothetical protein [Halobacterium salinarum]MCF2206787.1 hypothetical protein [Halobacterium salinarum]